MTDPITIGSAGVKFIFSSDTEGLSFSEVYKNAGTSTVYTVPAAHVFWILHNSIAISGTYPHISASILANGNKILSVTASDGETNANSIVMDTMLKITAGQTVQFLRDGVSSNGWCGMAVAGIETSA